MAGGSDGLDVWKQLQRSRSRAVSCLMEATAVVLGRGVHGLAVAFVCTAASSGRLATRGFLCNCGAATGTCSPGFGSGNVASSLLAAVFLWQFRVFFRVWGIGVSPFWLASFQLG